jgi:hypothetical protein
VTIAVGPPTLVEVSDRDQGDLSLRFGTLDKLDRCQIERGGTSILVVVDVDDRNRWHIQLRAVLLSLESSSSGRDLESANGAVGVPPRNWPHFPKLLNSLSRLMSEMLCGRNAVLTRLMAQARDL